MFEFKWWGGGVPYFSEGSNKQTAFMMIYWGKESFVQSVPVCLRKTEKEGQ